MEFKLSDVSLARCVCVFDVQRESAGIPRGVNKLKKPTSEARLSVLVFMDRSEGLLITTSVRYRRKSSKRGQISMWVKPPCEADIL